MAVRAPVSAPVPDNTNGVKDQEEKKPVDDAKKKDIEDEATDLETIIATQDANGMFETIVEKAPNTNHSNALSAKSCYEHVKNARKRLSVEPFTMETFADAKNDLNLGWNSLEEGIRAAGLRYKLLKVYAVPNIILIGFIVTSLLFIGFNYQNANFLNIIPIPVMIAGALGAVLVNLFTLATLITSRKYLDHWFTYTMYVPILGALLGTFAFLIVTGSVGVIPAATNTFAPSELTNSTTNTASPNATGSVGVSLTSSQAQTYNSSGLLFISFLAGIGWRKSIDAFQRVFDAFFGSKK